MVFLVGDWIILKLFLLFLWGFLNEFVVKGKCLGLDDDFILVGIVWKVLLLFIILFVFWGCELMFFDRSILLRIFGIFVVLLELVLGELVVLVIIERNKRGFCIIRNKLIILVNYNRDKN